MKADEPNPGPPNPGPPNPATVTALHHYPIKSCAGTGVAALEADELGPALDRRFMLIDEDAIFLSQRELPGLSLIAPKVEGDSLHVEAPGMGTLEVPLEPGGGRLLARVFADIVEVVSAGEKADVWFSEYLGLRCRLVHLPEGSVRPVDPDYASPGDRTTLADGFPFLVIGEASLEDLNARLAEPLPMNRFRPNIVVGGTGPFEEDDWDRIRIGGMEFRVVKPCSRCMITTVDQKTAKKGREPLTTLATYRRSPGGVLFGQNLIHEGPGTIEVGDEVEVL